MLIKIRPTEDKDLDDIVRIEKESFNEPWSRESFENALKLETAKVFSAVDQKEDVIGYFVLYFAQDQGELMTIAVRPGYRGLRIGDRLIKKMFEVGIELDLQEIYLEVRVSNEAARALYRNNGFVQAGLRKNFYRFPTEDAIVGMKDLKI